MVFSTTLCILVICLHCHASSDLLSNPHPVIYRNAPGKCSSNLVKCKQITRLDWCIHFCLYVFEGYLMLNTSFSVWAMKSSHLSFELGAIEDNPESQTNPPTMTGQWDFLDGNKIEQIQIQHFRHSNTENVHFFRFAYLTRIYSGNIVAFDDNKQKFELFLYEENHGVRTANSLKGWMDQNGTVIDWLSLDISDAPIEKSVMIFSDTTFTWPRSRLPRSRGCYNYGPLDRYTYENIETVCGQQPETGEYNGQSWNFTQQETTELDRQLNDGESACPVCDIKQLWREYYACSQRFKSMKAESNRCQQIMSSTSLLGAAKWICSSRLQLCVKFRSATFTAAKIELCPVPSIRIIKDDIDGNFDAINDATFPDANPVIFGCIDFPVTSGLLGEMNERTKTKFVVAGKKAKIAWYVTWWGYAKVALFTIGGILFIRWLLKRPSAEDMERSDYEEFDDAKFFEEYGDFYSEETEEENEEDLYDGMF